MPAPQPTTLTNILLPTSSSQAYDVTISDSTITRIIPHQSTTATPPSLLLPTLCHPHIHLDKPYLLTSNNTQLPSHHLPPCCHSDSDSTPLPSYTDLTPQSGTFSEALTNTSTAKTRFTKPDLFLRGSQLLAQSHTQGVTSARCFVEVDHVTHTTTLEVGLNLKRIFEGSNAVGQKLVRVQICAFAQDPIFSTPHGESNRQVLSSALSTHASSTVDHTSNSPSSTGAIEVLGTTPYVETSRAAALQNIDWAITTALRYDIHLDFHLDYNLDPTPDNSGEGLMVWEVIRLLRAHAWPTNTAADGKNGKRKRRTVVLGHCSALTLLSHEALRRLSKQIRESELPIFFVGLPASDLYMMGRPAQYEDEEGRPRQQQQQPMSRSRGTLNPVLLEKEYGIEVVLGVNNVGNAFTPWGSGDPLQLASMGVGLYHGGTGEAGEVLFGSVSWRARRAVGLGEAEEEEQYGEGAGGGGMTVRVGMSIDEFGLLVVENEEWVGCPGVLGMKVPGRRRLSVRDVVWDVPEVRLRRVVR